MSAKYTGVRLVFIFFFFLPVFSPLSLIYTVKHFFYILHKKLNFHSFAQILITVIIFYHPQNHTIYCGEKNQDRILEDKRVHLHERLHSFFVKNYVHLKRPCAAIAEEDLLSNFFFFFFFLLFLK